MYESVLLDVGGTFVKCGCMRDGELCLKGQFPIDEAGSAEEILIPILDFLTAHPAPRAVICMPGPANYETGACQMAHKFAAIRDLPMKPWLEARLPGTKVSFLHDGVAFMLGEQIRGEASGCDCAAGVMLGTGLGFALCRGGRVLVRTVRTPAHPLWCAPWRGGIAEDFVSGRSLRRQWMEQGGEPLDVHEIAMLARCGDARAKALFSGAGQALGEILTAHLRDYPVERIVVGGQIARSWDLFAPAFRDACSIPALPARHIGSAALYGNEAYGRHGDALLEVVEA